MKHLKMFFIAVGLFCLTACSGSASYNPEKCEQLKEKIRDKQPLTEADFSEMIDQMEGVCDLITKKQTEAGDDKAKYKEFADSNEARDALGYLLGFGFYIDSHKSELSKSNLKKLEKAMEKFKKLDDNN
ncbi:MAG: hypothetical protein HDR88_11235 [Bacteroides sp.]|nr:hypothetical protein [Bacteroides sp.]